ncbi:MAG: hypothetical protein V1879_05870 [Pseudomonadota bacterium]
MIEPETAHGPAIATFAAQQHAAFLDILQFAPRRAFELLKRTADNRILLTGSPDCAA